MSTTQSKPAQFTRSRDLMLISRQKTQGEQRLHEGIVNNDKKHLTPSILFRPASISSLIAEIQRESVCRTK